MTPINLKPKKADVFYWVLAGVLVALAQFAC